MRHRWPEDTRFTRVVLEVEDNVCAVCGAALHICDHRRHRIFTLQGPVEVVGKFAHGADRQCAARAKTRSPYAETTLTLPWWLIGWDVFCWRGHRRFARNWSVPQIRGALADTSQIPLSADAIEDAFQRYQTMLAARQQDPQVMAAAYRHVDALVLSLDGLQPEKGHETLSVVRELHAKRLWCAEALLSSNADEVRRLVSQARAWATQLGLPVHLWLSGQQDAFVTGIAAEFPGGPHRYCVNPFMRDLAKPMLETDSHAKVKMRSKVRGLRAIEREVLQQRQLPVAEAPAVAPVTVPPVPPPPANPLAKDVPVATDAGEVVLDYCSAVRGILNDDQGGPLQPPGLRMAEALGDVRASLQRNLDAHRGGRAHTQLQRLAGCIDRGVAEVREEHTVVRQHLQEIQRLAATLTPANGAATARQAQCTRLQEEFAGLDTPFYHHVAGVMASFTAGLFVGGDTLPCLQDNLDLERWFRQPKGHERRIHGHRHAGVRIVQEGPTLLLVLDAHMTHPEPFTAHDLEPYQDASAPACQVEALHRRKIMRKARSKKNERSCSQHWNVGT